MMAMAQRSAHLMTIGLLARRVDVTARTLRYYERIGLLTPTTRSAAGYRLYGERDAERVAFIRRAQAFGLSLDEIARILAVRDAGSAPCQHVQALAETRVRALDARIAELLILRDELASLADSAARVATTCAASDTICLAFSATA